MVALVDDSRGQRLMWCHVDLNDACPRFVILGLDLVIMRESTIVFPKNKRRNCIGSNMDPERPSRFPKWLWPTCQVQIIEHYWNDNLQNPWANSNNKDTQHPYEQSMYTGQPGCSSRRQGCRLCRPIQGHPKNYIPIESCQYMSVHLNTTQYISIQPYHIPPYSTYQCPPVGKNTFGSSWMFRGSGLLEDSWGLGAINQRGHLQIFTVHLYNISNMHLYKVLWLLCPTEICKRWDSQLQYKLV